MKLVKFSDKANRVNPFLDLKERANEMICTAFSIFIAFAINRFSSSMRMEFVLRTEYEAHGKIAIEPTYSLQEIVIGFQRKRSLFVSNFLLFPAESFLDCKPATRLRFPCE